jgi:transposase, IS5 family
MKYQTTFLSLGCLTKRTRADRFLEEMNRVVPWADLAAVVAPHYRPAGSGRPQTEVELLLRLHCLQLWYNLSDPGLEDAVHDRLSFQRFLGLDPLNQRVPDETTVLNFRRLLESHQLSERVFAKVNEGLAAQGLLVKTGTVVDATILSAPGSTKNQDGKRDPEMSSTEKNGHWHFGMKAHIGVDAKSGLVHTVKTTTASVHDSQVFTELTHGEETVIAGDSAYANAMLKANCRQAGLVYLIHDKGTRAKPLSASQRHRNRQKSSLRCKVEFPFRIIKHLWGHASVRYRGLAKNSSRLHLLFALSNLYQVRRALLAAA